MRRYAHERVQSALFPQNYRLRRDPVSGATYLACTFVWDRPDEADWEGFADIDYWQGLVLYGLYTQAKYGADWEQMRDHWPLIRGLASYWEATNSWALMGPGARESGELFHGDMPTAGYAGLVGFHRLAQRLGTPYQRDLAAYLLARNAVPMGCKLGFLDYALQAPHQEASWSRLPSTGFGERWLASFPGVDPSVRDYGPKDPWWRTGCIGPQSVQPEVLDLYLRRCPDELLTFERTFMGACPDGAFKTHDEVRVPPHIMARLQLPGDMPRLGEELATAWRRSYLLRDAHIAAALAARDVPLRLIDWTPAYIEQATWEPATRSAGVELTSPEDFGLILAVQGARPSVTIDGVASAVQAGGRRARWRAYTIGMPRGRHVVRVGVSGREG